MQTTIGTSSEFFQKQIEEAHKIINGTDGLERSVDFPEQVNQRLAVANDFANGQIKKVAQEPMNNSYRLINQSNASKTRANKIMWLLKATDQFSKSIGPVAACKEGCSHCCHIPVSITRVEAERIAKSTGKPIQKNPSKIAVEASYDNPCVFLEDRKCSIYENRPIACRTYFKLDADNLLCQLIPGASVPVPLANSQIFSLLNFNLGGTDEIADIRNWFALKEGLPINHACSN